MAGPEGIVCQRPTRDRKGYLYERFIPQIQEIIRKYDPDGFWYDGDYGMSGPCWCPNCLREWKADMGTDAPRKAGDPDWRKWLEWHQKRYHEYLRLVAEAIHKASPKAMYTSNWSWSWTPEPIPDFADTLSGDAWNIQAVVLSTTRRGAQQKTPWDTMSFQCPQWRSMVRGTSYGYSMQRTFQEGALTFAAGGTWNAWTFGGDTVPPYGIDATREMGEWALDRKDAVGPSVSAAQVAVLDSETSLSRSSPDEARDLTGFGTRVCNVARSLQEGHYLTDIVNEETWRKHLTPYQVVIVPQHKVLAPETMDDLRGFVEKGGLALFTGTALWGDRDEDAASNALLLGVERSAKVSDTPAAMDLGGRSIYLPGLREVKATSAEVLVKTPDGRTILTAKRLGKGTIAYLALDQLIYPDDRLMGAVLRKLGKGPSYSVTGAGQASVVCNLRTKPGQIVLHVTDLSARVNGAPTDIDTTEYTDSNPPLTWVTVNLPLPEAPKSVRALPTLTMLRSSYKDGILTVALNTMQTHAAVIIDTAATGPTAMLPADAPYPEAVFHPEDNKAGLVFSDGFEAAQVGSPPLAPWAPEVRGDTKILVTDETAASGKRSVKLIDTPASIFFPFLHRTVTPFRHGNAKLSFDLRVDAGAFCEVEARYEGKGAGPSVDFKGDGSVSIAGKEVARIKPGEWFHVDIDFRLGGPKPGYDLSLTRKGEATVTIRDLPYASSWFYLCDSVYFVGAGETAGTFYLDNISLERLSTD